MRKTINQIGMCMVVILALSACKSKKEPSPAVQDFLKQLDGKTLDEARDILKEEDEKVGSFLKFMSNFKDEKPQHIKPEDEEEGIPFTPPDPTHLEDAYRLALSDVGFNQTYSLKFSVLEPDGPSLRSASVEDPEFIARELYFHDGSKKTEKLDLGESQHLASLQTVDSAVVDVTYRYPTKVTAVDLDNKHEKASFKGAAIKLVKIKDNCVRVALEKEAIKGYLEMEAFNKDGKLLSRSSYQQGPDGDENLDDLLKSYQKAVQKLLRNLEKGSYKDVAALQKDVVDEMPDLTPFDNPKKGYVEAFFKGNVARVKMYFKDDTKSVTKTMVLHNNAPNYSGLARVQDPASGKFGFVSTATGQLVIPYSYEKLQTITPWFFVTSDSKAVRNYRLDTASKKLVPVKGYVYDLTPELVKVAEGLESKYAVMKSSGELLLQPEWDNVSIDPVTKLLFANKITEDGPLAGLTTIYDTNGKVITGPLRTLDNFSDGLLLVWDKAGKASFIDPQGKKVIDVSGYADIDPFSEGLAFVENQEGKYGFIDTKGRVAIPFEYASVTSFNLGLSLVTRKNGEVTEAALINSKGEQVVPFKESEKVDTDDKGTARVYTLQNKKFDAWGKEKR